MSANQQEPDGATRLAYILGVPLAENGRSPVAADARDRAPAGSSPTSKAISPNSRLEVGKRLEFEDVVVVEWTCDYGDGRLYRNVTIAELEDGRAVRVTDYWGEPVDTGVAPVDDRPA